MTHAVFVLVVWALGFWFVWEDLHELRAKGWFLFTYGGSDE